MINEINIGDALTNRAYLNPNREALFDVASERRCNFAELNDRANRCSSSLHAMGLTKGDRVALLLHNRQEFLESFFGPAKAGLVLMPLNWRLTADELSFILKDGGATVIVFDAEFAPVVEQIRNRGEAGSDIEQWICIGGETPDYAVDYEELLVQSSADEPSIKAVDDDNQFIM
jgi:acyl-CoA synthetase (AMP-forming)/AMP-acid ligase II